jgi:O-acetylserine/cysteine efflux transporter
VPASLPTAEPPALAGRALALALAVVVVWGTNFVVIANALRHFPPLLFATLRFMAVVFPLVLLVPRPAVPWRLLAGYGIAIGAGQFGLLFIAIDGLIAPGLASLLAQTQVVFTIALVMAASRVAGRRERLHKLQWPALALALAGMALIAANTGGDASAAGVALVVGAAFCWAVGNVVQRAAGPVPMLAFIAWSSLFAVPPLAALALWFEGWPAIRESLTTAPPSAWVAVVWQAVGNSLFGYGVWGWLLVRYPAASVAPLSLLVPVFGMAAAALFWGEALPPWKLAAAALILAGLALNTHASRQARRN